MNIAVDAAQRHPSFFGSGVARALSAEQVDRLREIGGRLLRESREYKRLLCSLEAPGCAG
jgi:hypothetical protein